MKVERYELEDKLIPVMKVTYGNKKKVSRIIEILEENNILNGKVNQLFNKPELIKAEDPRMLYLLTNALYLVNVDRELEPKLFFTEQEIKESKTYKEENDSVRSKPILPLFFDGVLQIDEGVYKVVINNQLIDKLLVKGELNYNFESQREAKVKKNADQIIQVATLNNQSVHEIAEHLVEGTLVYTDLIFNARIGTSDEGEEVVYDKENNKLMITKGSIIDVVDGYHRIKGNQRALTINPNISFNFPVTILNTNVEEARRYVGQIGKANPISKSRARELSGTNYSSLVVKKLRQESMLKGMISDAERLIRLNKEIVTNRVLLDGIEKEFPTRNKIEAMDVADYLVKFFDNLIGRFQNEFIDNYNEFRRTSLINHNLMFRGYIILAKRLQEANREPSDIVDIIKCIDFSRNNKLWEDISVTRNGRVFHSRAERAIIKYFKNLEI